MKRGIPRQCTNVSVSLMSVLTIVFCGVFTVPARAQSASALSNLVGTDIPRSSERAAALSRAAAALDDAATSRSARSGLGVSERAEITRMRDSASALRADAAEAVLEVAGNNPWL